MPTSGKITYWESLSNAANVDPNRQRQQSVQGAIGGMLSGESITNITEAEARGFVLTFSSGRLAHLTVSDAQGRPSINATFLRSSGTQSGGIFGSLRGVFSSNGWKRSISAVRAGRSVQRGQRYIVAGTRQGQFQVWNLDWNGSHTMAYDVDARDDLLKALAEGGEVFYDHEEHVFEVLDFTLCSYGTHGKEIAKPNTNGDCQIFALTVLTGPEASKYALIGLSLVNGSVTVDVVHPISCYRASIAEASHFRPQILVPELAQTAIVVFEQCIVLVSLVEIEETPTSQLQLEAHTLPGPFQDVVVFRKDRPYRVVGCAVDFPDRADNHQSCVVVVQNFGIIRITALSTSDLQSPTGRTAVTAQTKIEQAVFFGSMQQNLLDFSPKPELNFSREDVEAAALNISHSIASSTSPYLAALTPSMEHQLAKRATALADLNRHLRKYYPLLRPSVRWSLCWNAEKMAAAQALWRWYNFAISNPDNGPKDIFAEMIEAIPENLKKENQLDSGEPDGVRHWFIHDIWRLEWVIPYSHEIVELLFKESVEDRKEFDAVTKAKMTSNAVDIQLATLETAFNFREENAAAYGFESESLTDGVLQSVNDFENIPEFWTSSSLARSPALILARVKELIEVSRELAKLLASDVDDYMDRQEEGRELEAGQQEIDAEQTHAVMTKLAKESPRQIQICCQTFIERFRWLKSREDSKSKAEGEALTQAHFIVRRQQFVDLTDLDLAEQGIALAEKYWDMEALLDIFERENGDTNRIGPSIPGRISRYFVKFGTRWADAYFTRNLREGKEAVEILNNDLKFKPHLTKFLRLHPEYANMAWINEVSTERDYTTAAAYLDKAARQNDEVWTQKVMLSISKLSVMAARAKEQVASDAVKSTMQRTDHQVALLRIQEALHNFFRPLVQAAIDNDAAVDLVMEHYGPENADDRPYLVQRLKHDLQRFLTMHTLQYIDLIDILTLIHINSVEAKITSFISMRFFHALEALKHSSAITDSPILSRPAALVTKLIWRRILISSDWTVFNHTELKDDAQVSQETVETALFQTLLEGYRTRMGPEDQTFWDTLPPPTPADILGAGTTMEELRSLPQYSKEPDAELARLAHDLEVEDNTLQRYIDDGRLEEWYQGILEAAKSAARDEADRDGEEKVHKREIEKAFKAKMAKKDREKHGSNGITDFDENYVKELSLDAGGDVDMSV